MFADLRAGGRALADVLAAYRTDRAAIVLAIVRGGVPAAVEVARTLDLPLDLVLGRPLIQSRSGYLLHAVRIAGALVVDERYAALPSDGVERVALDEGLSALAARELVCRGRRPPARIAGRTVLLVDNGMRTGQTMAAAIRALRMMKTARIVAAVPVAAAEAAVEVARIADDVQSVTTTAVLGNVAMGYSRFDVPRDDHILSLLDQ